MTDDELEDLEQKQHALDALNRQAARLKEVLEAATSHAEELDEKLDELIAKAERLKGLTG